MFIQTQGGFGYILDVDEWPGEIVSTSGGFDPRGFFWKTCFCMKLYCGSFDTWEFINFVYGFWCVFGHECLYMLY